MSKRLNKYIASFDREQKESIRMMNSQRSDTEKNNLIDEGKKIRINEVAKRIEIINSSLKP